MEHKVRWYCPNHKRMFEGVTIQQLHSQTFDHPCGNDEYLLSLGLKDKNGVEVYEQDIIKIYVHRDNYTHHTNNNHGGFYLNAQVLDVQGNLNYNKEKINALREPMGREKTTQRVDYDYNIFRPYHSERIVRDENGDFVKDPNDKLGNYLRYLDIEVIGNMRENMELFCE